jgi:hypothetical protein
LIHRFNPGFTGFCGIPTSSDIAAPHKNLTMIRLVHTGKHFNEGGFPRPIVANQPDNLTRTNPKANPINSIHIAERFSHIS